jgi:hypothetical protein
MVSLRVRISKIHIAMGLSADAFAVETNPILLLAVDSVIDFGPF